MDQSTAPILWRSVCTAWAAPSRGETLEEACAVHGVDCDELIEKLNAHLEAQA